MAKWTAEIRSGKVTLYAWVAFNPKWGTFATLDIEHARTFETEAEVTAWVERLKVE